MVSREDRVYYEQELRYLEEEGLIFSERFPEIARYLGLHGRDPGLRDPHAERIIESFAFLVGKLRRFLDAQFPELVHSFFYMLYPQYLRPIPSKTIVQLKAKANMVDKPLLIPRGTEMYAHGLANVPYTFTSCWDIWIQPVHVKRFFIDPESTADYGISLVLAVDSGAQATSCDWDKLEFMIHGDPSTAYELFQKLVGQLRGLEIKGAPGWSRRLEIHWSGFEADHNYDEEDTGRFGYLHYLRDYFDYPQRFFYFRILGLNDYFEAHETLEDVQIDFTFTRPFATGIKFRDDNLRLFTCVAQNLYQTDCEPFKVDGIRLEYPLFADSTRADIDIHSVRQVVGSFEQNRQSIRPFYRFDHFNVSDEKQWFYTLRRETSLDQGWNCYARFIDLNHEGPGALKDQTISTLVRCTNKHHVQKLKLGQLNKLSRDVPETISVSNIAPASPAVWPKLHSVDEWEFVAHLSLDFTEIDDLESLQCLLNLYHLSNSEAGKRRIRGIQSLNSERDYVIRKGCCILGRKINLELDSSYYPASGDLVLFNRVFGFFLKSYCPINSFISLVVQDAVSRESYDFTVWS